MHRFGAINMGKEGIRAVVFGCRGTELTSVEAQFFERINPLGFILFSRNLENPEQTKKLVDSLRKSVGRNDAPILVDQEGGRVSRLPSSLWPNHPPAEVFGKIAEDLGIEEAQDLVYQNYYLIGRQLQELGITVNCSPVLDLPIEGADPIIDDRAFGSEPSLVAILGLKAVEGLQDAGIIPVLKHFPGHGRAPVDSHKILPIVKEELPILMDTDFYAFQQVIDMINQTHLKMPWGMTAHILYPKLDEEEPATHSAKIVSSIIRQYCGFNGFLITDCLTMKALKGTYSKRTEKSYRAGCDAVLHCSADLDEMIEVGSAAQILSEGSIKRLQSSLLINNGPKDPSWKELEKSFWTRIAIYA